MENKELEALKEKYADFIAGLSDEDKAKVDACRTVEQLAAIAQSTEGELPDDIAEAVAGGKGKEYSQQYRCPKCHHCTFVSSGRTGYMKCDTCNYEGIYTKFQRSFE